MQQETSKSTGTDELRKRGIRKSVPPQRLEFNRGAIEEEIREALSDGFGQLAEYFRRLFPRMSSG